MTVFLNCLYFVALLFLSPWLIYRSIKTGRYRQNLRAKFIGSSNIKLDPSRSVAWFHGVSVGEIHLLRTVVKAFLERHSDWQVVVSASTDTGLAEARKHFSNLTVIVFPFDFSWGIRNTLRKVNPKFIALAESELWPNFLRIAARNRIPVIAINGRMSPRSFRRYSRIAWLACNFLFKHVTMFLMQSDTYANNLRNLGVPKEKIAITGSVKYDGTIATKDNQKTAELAKLLAISNEMLVWVAGSTHEPEERIAISCFKQLNTKFPGLCLILVPRAPERFNEVAELITATGLDWTRKSQLQQPLSRSSAIYLIDTLGELNAVWGLATVGFTGGSLNESRGGQSMIEPAGYGVPILFGPHTWNFRDAVSGLLERKAAMVVKNEEELTTGLEQLLSDKSLRDEMGIRAKAFVDEQRGATTRTIQLIEEIIKGK